MNCGSVDSFQVWTMCGLRPNARQIRETAVWDMPADLAIDRVDQCVSPFGGACSSVAAITFSTCSSVIVRGRPGRGSSFSPSSRDARNRDRHLPAVVLDIPSSAATPLTGPPSAQASTIRDRSARACAVFRRRAHPSRTWRSSSVSTTGSSFGLAMSQAYKLTRNYCLRTLAGHCRRSLRLASPLDPGGRRSAYSAHCPGPPQVCPSSAGCTHSHSVS